MLPEHSILGILAPENDARRHTMMLRKTSVRVHHLICGCLFLAACNGQNWRAQAIASAEEKMRTEVNFPAAEFSKVQVTGNSATGQTCGYVTVKSGHAQLNRTARFIVYIDGTAGPYIEGDLGMHPVSQQRFDFAWQYDCLKEGYKS